MNKKNAWTNPDELPGRIQIINRGTYENPGPLWDNGMHLTVNSTLQFCLKVTSIQKYHLNIILNYKSSLQVANYC